MNGAMRERRSPKDVMRGYWAEEYALRLAAYSPASGPPVYLTLPGAEGLDIRFLQAAGLVGSTEVGGIPADDLDKIVAVERSSDAVFNLLSVLPGLRIHRLDIRDLLRGNSQTRFPDTDQRAACRALIVNLDLNAPLKATLQDDRLLFPILVTIEKLARLHADTPVVRSWSLLLTLHGDIVGPGGTFAALQGRLADNCRRVGVFRTASEALLPEAAMRWVLGDTEVAEGALQRHAPQLLMAYVPKAVIEIGRHLGWAVLTHKNVAYPGESPSPGMVSWVFRFDWEPRTQTDPEAVYTACVSSVLANVEMLDA